MTKVDAHNWQVCKLFSSHTLSTSNTTLMAVFYVLASAPRSMPCRFTAYTQHVRHFCSTVPRFRPYLVWAPDYTDDEALARRMAIRPKHVVNANRYIKQGILSKSI